MIDKELDPFDQPLKHLPRVAPPWAAEARTVCGRPLSDVASWVSFEEGKSLANKVGYKRAQFLFCQVCLDRHAYKAATPARWEREPAKITADWAQRAAWHRSQDGLQVSAELLALGALVGAHREEFDALVASQQGNELATRRQRRSS